MAYLLVFAILAAFFISAIALYRYGDIQRHHPLVTISVLIAWCFSFLIVFAIPLDITSTVYRQCLQEQEQNTTNATNTLPSTVPKKNCQKPWGMVPENVFPDMWRIIYWSSQFLTWLIMPLMQSYLKAGDFTIKGKLKAAVIDNAIYYCSYLVICSLLFIYLALQPGVYFEWPKLKAIASSASNTWGLFLLVLLLGYALVEVPRNLWNNSKPGFTLQLAYFKTAKLSSEKAEAEEHLEDVIDSLQAASRAVPNNHPLRINVETILRKVPTELMSRTRNLGGRDDASSTVIPSEKALIRLHHQVIKSMQTFQRTEALWSVQLQKVFRLEDIARNMHSADRVFKSDQSQYRKRPALVRILCSPVIEWYWECKAKAPLLKAGACMLATVSLMVVWSELTFFNRSPVLSILANVINMGKHNYDFMTIEIFSMGILCYLSYCAFSTVLKIKFLNLYYLAPHHQTNEHSLIFSGMMLSRLTPPMCLNFLGLIHMDSHIIKNHVMETYYTQIMGHMDVIGIIADGFNIYFPMLMLAFCLATWFSLGSRALNALGFQQFMLNEDMSVELVQEGKDLAAREKRRLERAREAQVRRAGNESVTNKYRSTFRDNVTRSPGDGLLRDGEVPDYSTNVRDTDLSRSLSEEINERFGVSTQVEVGFRGESQNRTGPPPRGLFDDV